MLAIGRALMANPRLLLLDEPSEGLAPQIVAEVQHDAAGLKAAGCRSCWSSRTWGWRWTSPTTWCCWTPAAWSSPGTRDAFAAQQPALQSHLGVA